MADEILNDLNGAWDDYDEVPDDATHALTIELVADNYFKDRTWYLNNWREVHTTSEVVSGKNNISGTDSKNKLSCADHSDLNLTVPALPNKGYLDCVIAFVQNLKAKKGGCLQYSRMSLVNRSGGASQEQIIQ